uniref:Uncharacterized protein n=1 Tax=Oryza brachyantha TaxID=4533 RepID=J3MKS4_ORYBR
MLRKYSGKKQGGIVFSQKYYHTSNNNRLIRAVGGAGEQYHKVKLRSFNVALVSYLMRSAHPYYPESLQEAYRMAQSLAHIVRCVRLSIFNNCFKQLDICH